MKQRVLSNLESFSTGNLNDLGGQIIDELGITSDIIKKRSNKIVQAILNNYTAFSITTIDSFTHTIIKNFAHDLGIALNFQVELDANSLLNESVDVLVSKIGIDQKLTNLLIDFSLEKTDNDSSWDISNELNEVSKIILSENDMPHFKKLSNKTIEDFTSLKKKLKKANSEIDNTFLELATKGLQIIENQGIQHKDFSRATLPNFFIKFQNFKSLDLTRFTFQGSLLNVIENDEDLYPKRLSQSRRVLIDEVKESLVSLFYQIKNTYEQTIQQYVLNKLMLSKVIPLAVVHRINQELEVIKKENNICLIAEFNRVIYEHIKDQPAPFIYERIGQRYRYYFIDEMQDTSELQWTNLVPLIDNALSQEDSSLMLVGDGKQAIYRWRGGKADQFINLGMSDFPSSNPFSVKKVISQLDTNYRSYSELISFNNDFFQYASLYFNNELYKEMYIQGNKQLSTSKKGGYVSITFLENEKEKEQEELKFPKKVLEKILFLREEFSLDEICVIVRKKKEGVAVANYLSENGINILSSEILLLKNSTKVVFIINLLQVINDPNNEEARFEVLYFLHQHLGINLCKDVFFKKFAKQDFSSIREYLKTLGVEFDVAAFFQYSLYEKVEQIIRSFKLINSSDAYVQFFLDEILEQQHKGADIQMVLDYWEQKKSTLSIVASDVSDAVQIMTIHKSKGLEFPVVIFPYDFDIYNEIKPTAWISKLPISNTGFEEFMISSTSQLKVAGEFGEQMVLEKKQAQELDSFNLLYVVLTRAKEQLYVITQNQKESTSGNRLYYSTIFKKYLKENYHWEEATLAFSFGDDKRVSKPETHTSNSETLKNYISTSKEEHQTVLLASSSSLWGTSQGDAVTYGNLIHEMLAQIYTEKDIEPVVKKFYQQGIVKSTEVDRLQQMIKKIVNHQQLQQFFLDDNVIYNERALVDENKMIIIPDRLIFNKEQKVSIIDYKTGKQMTNHQKQITHYEGVLQSMGFSVINKILVYIDEVIVVREVY